ncbi:MAG: alpha/beta family hydrolase, partial [Nitriliruptorales bacterium]
RVASLAVAAGLPAVGLLFYGYPLHAPGKPHRLRTDHWPLVGAPSLFLQGTRDALCDVALLKRELPLLAAPPTLHLVEGGDHSLAVRAADTPDGRRRPPGEVLAALVPAVVGPWLAALSDRG